ncbi:hypothetical protein [Oscillatoria sp. FACHB-1407]|nr:hypothetical protein [Oscillatoria sp. FACHB-1407]
MSMGCQSVLTTTDTSQFGLSIGFVTLDEYWKLFNERSPLFHQA